MQLEQLTPEYLRDYALERLLCNLDEDDLMILMDLKDIDQITPSMDSEVAEQIRRSLRHFRGLE